MSARLLTGFLALPLLLHPPATAAAESAARGVPEMTFTGQTFPPTGSPEDQALLGSMLTAQADMLGERATAIRLMQRLKDGRYDERLAVLAKEGPPEAARHAEDLRRRLAAAWDRDRAILTSKWPVDPRLGCRERGIQFEVLMGAQPGTRAAAELPLARAYAKACLDRQLTAIRPLREATRTLVSVLSEVEAALTAARGDARGVETSAGGAAAAPGSAPASAGSQ